MLPLTLVFSAIFLFSWWWLLRQHRRNVNINPDDNVLLVTAHPDDELMFFGPTLLNELRIRTRCRRRTSLVHLLCLSTGDYYGDGSERHFELSEACEYLLKSSYSSDPESISTKDLASLDAVFRWKVLNDQRLKDSPDVEWPRNHIRKLVMEYIDENRITKVITFDQHGISGHRNHQAISEAIRQISRDIPVWTLETVPLIRKYMAAFDVIGTLFWSWWNDPKTTAIHLVPSLKDYLNLVRSLRQHRSQMVWFRYLYQATSRYMFINTLILNQSSFLK